MPRLINATFDARLAAQGTILQPDAGDDYTGTQYGEYSFWNQYTVSINTVQSTLFMPWSVSLALLGDPSVAGTSLEQVLASGLQGPFGLVDSAYCTAGSSSPTDVEARNDLWNTSLSLMALDQYLYQDNQYLTSAPAVAAALAEVFHPVVTAVSPAAGSAAGGTTVTITGTGFSGTTVVDFGATAATNVVVVSGTQITATSPAGTGVVDVTVTTAGGASATSAADKFTYVAVDSQGVYGGGYWYTNVNGTTQIVAVPSGWAGAIPVTGDWNGAGKTKIGLFNNATATWWLDTVGDGVFRSSETFTFGFSGSDVVPVVGDWNGAPSGSGKTEVGVYANGAWFRDVDGTHTWDAANQAAVAYLGWAPVGTQVVTPVPGDWAGDGKTEMGVYSDGVWFLDSTGSNQWDDAFTYWGWDDPALIPVAGNWSGSGTKSQLGVYDQGVWFLDYDNSHTWDAVNQTAVAYYGWAGRSPWWAIGATGS